MPSRKAISGNQAGPARRPRITLRQIGLQLGLSTFAVSRSLAGKDGVSDETRQRVEAAAARLAYRRPQSDRERRDIGLVFHRVDPVNGELSLQIERGVQREAQRHRRTVRFQSTQTAGQIAALAKHCAGLLLVGAYDSEVSDTIRAMKQPVVRLGWVNPLERIDQVRSTDREAAQAVAEYLLRLGHRSVGFVFGSTAYRGRWERFYGAREVLERAGDAALHPLEFEEKTGGFLRALRALHGRDVRPTAFFCAHDGLALTVISELLRVGSRIPEDASVVGFGDYAPAMQIEPQLTTVRVDGVGMGVAAIRLLLERVEADRGEERLVQRILIPALIVERASTGPRCLLAPEGRRSRGAASQEHPVAGGGRAG